MKGIIFDMDGTMVDNMMIHHQAWQRKLRVLGMDMSLEEVKESIHGVNEEIVERLFGDRFTTEQRRQIAWEKEKEYRDIFSQNLQPIAGLVPFLDHLQDLGIPLAIGTAAPPENVDFVLDNLKLRNRFQSVLHSEHVNLGKPNPEIFLKSAHNLGVPIDQCLVFEDSVVGAETALNAGCQAVIVTSTHDEEEFKHFPNIIKYITDYQNLNINSLKQSV